jgi:hypothetical protein
MQALSITLGQRRTKGELNTLVIYSLFALGVGLLALLIALVSVLAVLRHAEFYVSLDSVVGVGASSAPWSTMGGYLSAESETHSADVAQWNIVTEWPTAEVLQGP